MREKDFLYFILNENGEPYVADWRTGLVSVGSKNTLLGPTGSPAFLQKSPDGWKDIEVKYSRNLKYWGLFRDFTLQLKFSRDGATILKYLFYNYGIEAYAKLVILKADRSTWPVKYKTWYTGELDFSQFQQDRTFVTCNVMQGGLVKYLKAYEGTQYELSLNNYKLVKFDGIDIVNSISYTAADQTQMTFFIAHGDLSNRAYDLTWLQVSLLNVDGTVINAAGESTLPLIKYDSNTPYDDNRNPDNYFLQATADITVNFSATITVSLENGQSVELYIKNSNGSRISLLTLNAPSNPQLVPFSNSQTFTISTTINVAAGEKLYLISQLYFAVALDTVASAAYTGFDFSVQYTSKGQTSFVKAISMFDLANQLAVKISGGLCQAKSDLLTQSEEYVVTSGDAIRGIDPAVIKTSVQDAFQSFFSRFMAGMSVENEKLVIESLTYYFQDSVILDLGNVDQLIISVAEDIMFNTILAGYKPQQYDNANGKYEFNSEQHYTTPITRISKELNIESAFRADPYGMEFLRVNYDGKNTTDNIHADNDTFFVNIDPDAITNDGPLHYILNRPAYYSVTGIPSADTIFNLKLTPKRGIYALGPLLHSCLDRLDGKNITFVSADKNKDLTVVETAIGPTVAEGSSELISGLGQKLFLPYYFQFTTQVPVNLQEIIDANPYGQIAFTWKGVKYYGYLWEGGVKPGTNDVQEWKLLAATNNDMTKLIAA